MKRGESLQAARCTHVCARPADTPAGSGVDRHAVAGGVRPAKAAQGPAGLPCNSEADLLDPGGVLQIRPDQPGGTALTVHAPGKG